MRVDIEHVSKSYRIGGDVIDALSDLTFEIPAGQFAAIVGPSGCGKSTLLDLIAGLGVPSTGAIAVNGRTVHGPSAEMAIIPQRGSLFPWQTTLQNVSYGLQLQRVPRKAREAIALEMLSALGVSEFKDAYPHHLSGGIRQRVSVARALVTKPSILLMDEPFAALDGINRRMAQDVFVASIEGLLQTTIYVTHDIGEALDLADCVYVLSSRPGRLLAQLHVSRSPDTWPALKIDLESRIWELLSSVTPMAAHPNPSISHLLGKGIHSRT
jgi:NitT/TauT family transport system ATP-binding protein